ncbi:MAG: DNA-binding CsgD family transcriptional regulator [Alteromonadaceae bacterium]|jgi:DNA-binding CsgD family transcriptional regulator
MSKLPNLLSNFQSANSGGSPWQQFADQTSELFDADGCLFCFREIKKPDTPIAVGVGKLSEEFARQIISTTSKSPYYRLLQDSEVGRIIGNGDINTDPQADLKQYYGDVLQSNKFDQVMGAIVYRDDKYEAALSIARNKDNVGFAPHEQQLFNEFLPHLRAMIEIYFQHYLKPKNADVGAFINQLCENLAILDNHANVLQSNAAFDQLKSRKSLVYIYGGKVNFYDKSAQQWFENFLATEHSSGSSDIFRVKGDEQNTLLKLSIFGQKQKLMVDPQSPRFILSIDNFDADARNTQYKYLFNLTRAEAELAAHLSQGKTINQLADEKLLSKHTLRTQLKSIFMKTETHSQNELIVLLKNVV